VRQEVVAEQEAITTALRSALVGFQRFSGLNAFRELSRGEEENGRENVKGRLAETVTQILGGICQLLGGKKAVHRGRSI